MLIHFLNNYSIVGRVGSKLRIRGVFPGIKQEDYIYLNVEEGYGEEQTYKIEEIEYIQGEQAFKAVISVHESNEFELKA